MEQAPILVARIDVDPRTGIARLRQFDRASETSERKGRKAAEQLDKSFRKVRKGTGEAAKGARGLKGVLASIPRPVRAVGVAIGRLLPLLGVGAGLVGALILVRGTVQQVNAEIRESITVSREYEATLSRVGAVAGASAQELNAFRLASKELGGTTVFTARQVAESQFTLAKAGLSTVEILQATPAVLDLAAAGQLDLAEASGIASDVMRGMGLEVTELDRVMDVLTATATRSNQTIQDIGEAMKFAASTANLAGVELEETAGAMLILANRGIRGSLAGTGLSRVLQVLLGDLSEGEKGVGDLSKELFDATGKSIGLANSFDVMQRAGIGARQAFDVFGARAGRIAAILQTVGADRLRVVTEELRNVQGLTQEIAERNLDNLDGALVRLSSALERVRLEFAETFGPTLRATIDDLLVPFVQAIGLWIAGNRELKVSILEVSIVALVAARDLALVVDTLRAMNIDVLSLIPGLDQLRQGFTVIQLALIAVRHEIARAIEAVAGLLEGLAGMALLGPAFNAATGGIVVNLREIAAAIRTGTGGGEGGLTGAVDDALARLRALRQELEAHGDGESLDELIAKLKAAEARLKALTAIQGRPSAPFLPGEFNLTPVGPDVPKRQPLNVTEEDLLGPLAEPEKPVTERLQETLFAVEQYNADYHALLLENQGISATWAAATVSIYDSLATTSDSLQRALGENDKFTKGLKKIQAAALLVSGVISVKEGVMKIAKAGWPPNPVMLASGTAQVATGLSSIATAKQLGASGGAAGAGAGVSGGGAAGGINPDLDPFSPDGNARNDASALRPDQVLIAAEAERRRQEQPPIVIERLEAMDAQSFEGWLDTDPFRRRVIVGAVARELEET